MSKKYDGKWVLHVGAGRSKVPEDLFGDDWYEVTMDVSPDVKPDIIASIADMRVIPTESFDAVYCSHVVEHLYPFEVPIAFNELYRVLKPGRIAYLLCPDLQKTSEFILSHGLTATAYVSKSGPITPLDMLYGHLDSLAGGNFYMSHKCGFTASSLTHELECVGFDVVVKYTGDFELCAVAMKKDR